MEIWLKAANPPFNCNVSSVSIGGIITAGAAMKVNTIELLVPAVVCTVTGCGPVRPEGAVTVSAVSPHDPMAAATAPNRTTLVPCAAPKFAPETVTALPAAPKAGSMSVMTGSNVAATPVPDRETLCGLPAALLLMLTLADLAPVAVGLKDRLNEQLLFGASVALLHVFVATE